MRLNTRHGELTSRTPAAAPCPYESLILGEAEARIVAKDDNQWQEREDRHSMRGSEDELCLKCVYSVKWHKYCEDETVCVSVLRVGGAPCF